MSIIQDHDERIRNIEKSFEGLGYQAKQLVSSEFKKRTHNIAQTQTYFGVYTALCIDTIDPYKQGRIRFYSPELSDEVTTQVEQCQWAWPISAMGGFDDCGLVWVPPAGSMVCILFGRGSRRFPYYIGTTWGRDRGPDGRHNFGFIGEEFTEIHDGHRKGYLVSANDGSQCFPQWNTENYNGIDYDRPDFDEDALAKKKVTYPHIYGFKTPQKHMLKMVDGNYKCGNRYKRIEIQSSLNNWMIFKDDFLHPSGEWANPYCGCGVGGNTTDCLDSDNKPLEKPNDCVTPQNRPKCANEYFKHRNECAPYSGPSTPQNNKCALNQSGIQFLSRGGGTIIIDDSVEHPKVPSDGLGWENGLYGFNWGCTNRCMGKIKIISMTGHRFEMSDEEDTPENRGKNNYIRLLSACGNLVELNDETKDKKLGGAKRGITMRSTSRHTFEMIDEDNDLEIPIRQEIGKPADEATDSVVPEARCVSKAKKAFVRVRTGYGLEMSFNDDNSQENTVQQSIQIVSPQKDNTERGPHLMRFQEAPDGPGFYMLRVGGEYLCTTYDNHITVVGEEKHPASQVTHVFGTTMHVSDRDYVNRANVQLFVAKDRIILDAGEDCPDPKTGKKSGCIGHVLVYQGGTDPDTGKASGRIVISDRVFASASAEATIASCLFMHPAIGGFTV